MRKKRIVFDVPHLADFNLVKFAIINLSKDDRLDVRVYALRRGKLPEIVRKELPSNVQVVNLGVWKKGKYSKIFITNFYRTIQFIVQFICYKPDVGVSPGSLPFSAALRIFRKPSLQFSDDVERWFLNKLEAIFATEKYYPAVTTEFSNPRIHKIPMLKQWAYLSPKYFLPDPKALKAYNLEPKSYFFVREINTGSTNYTEQAEYLISKIAKDFPPGIQVALLLENKSAVNLYPSDWLLLKEPVESIHTIIYFSIATISTGDSMAREAGVLGVPSYYCGIRTMEANKILEKHNILEHLDYRDVPGKLHQLLDVKHKHTDQESFRKKLNEEFIEITDFIVDRTLKNLKLD